MFFPAALHKDPDTSYGVTIPDLPGCFSWGDTIDEAIANATEAIECHVEALLMDSEDVPLPGTVEQYRMLPDYETATWVLVSVDLSKLSGISKRVNISLPERILGRIDAFAERQGETRSGLLVAAALEYIGSHSSGPDTQNKVRNDA
jgi:predicted RNase H-like HicB family nuclease